MTEHKRPTLRAVAARAGVSPMTVTRVLRGDACVSDPLRTRVRAAVDALGYKPNPAASDLMSAIRRGRVASYRGKIAWIHVGKSPPNRAPNWMQPVFEGVLSHAKRAGYLLERIWLNDPHLQPERLTSVLTARGVQGVILNDYHPDLEQIQWDRCACAKMRWESHLPPVHCAGADYFDGVRESFHQLRALGYHRIGMMLHSIHDQERQGIEQHEDQIGSAAVDLVVGQLARGESGIPPFQKTTLIKGRWEAGATVRT